MSLEHSHLAHHTPDGSDPQGTGLEVQIRIAPDGRMYFHDIPPALVDVVLALNPADAALAQRLGNVVQPPTQPQQR